MRPRSYSDDTATRTGHLWPFFRHAGAVTRRTERRYRIDGDHSFKIGDKVSATPIEGKEFRYT